MSGIQSTDGIPLARNQVYRGFFLMMHFRACRLRVQLSTSQLNFPETLSLVKRSFFPLALIVPQALSDQ